MKKKVVFKTPWFSIEERKINYPKEMAGKPFYTLKSPNFVVVVIKKTNGKFLFTEQYRPAVEKITLEFPAGYVNKGEKPHTAAQRELYEETGYKVKKLHLVGEGYPMSSRSNAKGFIFFGEGLKKDKYFVCKEDIKVREFSFREIKKIALSGDFAEMPDLGALLLVYWKYLKKHSI